MGVTPVATTGTAQHAHAKVVSPRNSSSVSKRARRFSFGASSSSSSLSSPRTTRVFLFVVKANGRHTFGGTTNGKKSSSTTTGTTSTVLDRHIPIDRYYDNLRQIHQSPDIFIVDDYLSSEECDSIIEAARDSNKLKRSPVAYAGWTDDFKAFVELAARGPALWFAVINILYGSSVLNEFGLPILLRGVGAYAFALGVAVVLSLLEKQKKEKELQEMRTSSSCVLEGQTVGEQTLIKNTEKLLAGTNPNTFEAPTCIRYEPGQHLAAHFDANRGAQIEDAERGGQTLATLLVYLNDQSQSGGGETVFNRLNIKVTPKKGSALLFFPATETGEFDERVEHEGLEVLGPEDKWIVRIWKHENLVKEPFGLSGLALKQVLSSS
mgnify:FL=1